MSFSSRFHSSRGRAPYIVKAGSGPTKRKKGVQFQGDRIITLCGQCGSKMAWSAYDEIFFCNACGYNTELLVQTHKKEILEAEAEETTPVQLPDLQVKYTTTDNVTIDKSSSNPRRPVQRRSGFTKAIDPNPATRKTRPKGPVDDFDRVNSTEDRLNEKMGREVRWQNIQRRQSYDII